MNIAEFVEECATLGVELSPTMIDRFSLYVAMLLERNSKFNLTAIDTAAEVWRKHFLDSLSARLVMQSEGELIDVGSGAGFPGLPLAITCSGLQVTLVDSSTKRVQFLRDVVSALDLGDQVRIVPARAEDIGGAREHRERYDYAVARAVASFGVLAEYCLPLVKRGGAMIAMKGPAGHQELVSAQRGLKILGGGEPAICAWTLPHGGEQRLLIVVTKLRATPPKYPRRAGLPDKQPL